MPDKLQEDIDKLERTGFNPWRTRGNYAERTHTLLYIEEAQQIKNFRRFGSSTKSHISMESSRSRPGIGRLASRYRPVALVSCPLGDRPGKR